MAAPEPGPRAARGLRAFLSCFNPAAAAGGGCCSMPQADDRKPDGLDAADARNGGVRAKSSVGGRGFRRPLAPILTSRPAAAAAGGTGGITARHYQHQPEAADDLHSAAADAVELSSDESDPVAQGWGLPDPVVDLAPSAAAAAAAVARMPDSASGRTSGGRSAPLWAALACAAAESPAAAGDFDESADAYFDARSNFSLALSNGGSSAAVSRRSTLQQQAPSFGEISIPPQQHVAIGTAANMLISSADAFAVREGGGSKTVQLSRVSSTSSAAGGGGKVSRKVTCSSGSAATLAPAAAADAAAAPPQLDLPPIIMPAAAAAVGPPPLVVSSVRDAVAKQLSQQSAASAAPPPDLAFAPPGLTFIRVPKVTGLGGACVRKRQYVLSKRCTTEQKRHATQMWPLVRCCAWYAACLFEQTE